MISSKDILKKRILLIGSNGRLGQQLANLYKDQNKIELLCCSNQDESFVDGVEYRTLDITQKEEVKEVILDFFPDFVINSAAYTNVDKSEIERELAWKINVSGVEYMAQYSRIIDAHIIHISSDYIFDGKNGPYTEKDLPHPVGYYGRTKHAAENVLRIGGTKYTIIRPNVLYGSSINNQPDFVQWVIESLKAGKEINIVTDQINNPTYIPDLADMIKRVIEYEKDGIYNIGGREFMTRFEFTKRIAKFFNLDETLIKPITTEELKQPAARPLKSGLITLKAETELNYKPLSIEETFIRIKKELQIEVE